LSFFNNLIKGVFIGPKSWITFSIRQAIGISLYWDIKFKTICFYFIVFSLEFCWSYYQSEYKQFFKFYNYLKKND
jgi:hypothetical protein